MRENYQELLKPLYSTIEEMIKSYRYLLDVVRKEKDILISADLDLLNENNRLKESLLLKLRKLELTRQESAVSIAKEQSLPIDDVKLLDLVKYFDGTEGDKLRNYHSVLKLLLKRIQSFNTQNESLVKSALCNITGAIGSIKDTITTKPIYEKKGEVKAMKESGHLVNRQV